MSELFIFPSLVLHCEKKNVEIDFFQKCIVKSRKANLIFVGKRTLLQCVPIENYQDEMAVALKQCIFDPMLMRLRGSSFFSILKNVFTFFSGLFIIFQKTIGSQTHFGFTNMGSNLHSVSAAAISFSLISTLLELKFLTPFESP